MFSALILSSILTIQGGQDDRVLAVPAIQQPVGALDSKNLPDTSGRVFQVEFTVLTGDPLGSRKAGTQRILASPTLAMMSGREAQFTVGGEIPIPQSQPVQFATTGTILRFKVTGKDESNVQLSVQAENVTLKGQTKDQFTLDTKGAKLFGVQKLDEKTTMRISEEAEKQTWVEFTVMDITDRQTRIGK